MTEADTQAYAYLDYAATAPLCEEAAAALAPYCVPGEANMAFGGNANSLYGKGRTAFDNLERARKIIAGCLNASRPAEIIFTSGATEADNAALFGLVKGVQDQRAKRGIHTSGHVIVSAIEHDAVLNPAAALQATGVEVTYLKPNRAGFIDPETLKAALREDTLLVSIMMANSEIGSVQPVKQLAELAHKAGALFHTDATQALGKLTVDLKDLGVDAASFSGHKVGAPKGIGALYLKARTPFTPYLLGGGQEEGRRSGTQNVAGAAAFAAAVQAVTQLQAAEQERLSGLRDYLYAELPRLKRVSCTVDVPAGSREYLPNIVHVLVSGFESETLILRLDQAGFAVSGGSACASHSLEPSHVLKAIGVSPDKAYGALRVSMGRYTTRAQVECFVAALAEVIQKK